MKIKITKSTAGIGYGYMEGQELDLSDNKAMDFINRGYACMVTTNTDGLPEDIPGRNALLKAGFKTVTELSGITDFSQYDGISKAVSDKITEYLKH